LFTLSASANNNKVTRATLNFAKQTQLVKVDTEKAKKKIDKDAIIKELNALIEELRKEMSEKNEMIKDLKKQLSDGDINDIAPEQKENYMQESVFSKFDKLTEQINVAEQEENKWTVNVEDIECEPCKMSEDEMKEIFDEFDEDKGGSIDSEELQNALKKMGQDLSMQEVHDLIVEIDENGDGEVDFDEFKVMATKSWFVNAFQSKLVDSMQRMMTTMDLLGDDEDDDDEKNDDQSNEKLIEQITFKTKRIEHLEQNEKTQNMEIQKLQNAMNKLKEEYIAKNQKYEKQIEQLQNKLVENAKHKDLEKKKMIN